MEPVKCTAIDQRREVADPFTQCLPGWTHCKNNVKVRLDFRHEKVKHFLGCSAVVQLDVTFFLGVDAHFLRHKDFVIWTEQTWDLILIYKVVNVFKHKAGFELVVS
jgi:hypothetical protein